MSTPSTASPDAQVLVFDAVKALAFVGDLSMGQPVDHSARTAWIAAQLAATLGLGGDACANAAYVSLLRWSGCTANAPEFSELMGDDVGGRHAMLAAGLPSHLAGSMMPLAQIHCEVSGDVARTLGMPPAVELPLRRIFERPDGHGQPNGLRPPDIPFEVFIVSAASDLEIFSRVYDLERALSYLAARAGAAYPAEVVDAVSRHAVDWLHTLEQDPACVDTAPAMAAGPHGGSTSLELIADVIDLKLPWLTGYSRRVAQVAAACAERLGLPALSRQRLYRASLVHGIGRAAVPNALWDQPGAPSESAMERLRLVPYWTARAARRIGSLADEAELASHADERLDGSGYFRGLSGAALGIEARVLAAAAHAVLLQTARPGRAALSFDEAQAQLQREAQRGLFDADVVAALGGASRAPEPPQATEPAALLTGREVEVLRRISLGESNKEAARTLGISPSTVRAHLENIFRKLECTTRAAATLKAMTTGLL
ncbi:HD domain-containing phosphohydrolase [Rhizobacter sp. SG703]|uniref:HD domain-containing phosphohydrolase n=1 Tax=Rhizobacter sp. SG703 TaxID=2587140 RepID=UPI0014487CFA|nr:HD domain-containing phosphohydrolase [Rhizobacter sp. SG703]NKI93536.1 HD-GYP domain-containing protein (c-di-GMP phosphodiesterase class II) [Rhizobacter sp. SG703]